MFVLRKDKRRKELLQSLNRLAKGCLLPNPGEVNKGFRFRFISGQTDPRFATVIEQPARGINLRQLQAELLQKLAEVPRQDRRQGFRARKG